MSAPNRLAAAAGLALALVALGLVVAAVIREEDQVTGLIRDADPAWLVAAAVLALAGMAALGAPWLPALAAVGGRGRLGPVLVWFFAGQLGKYVPGLIWPIVGRAELAVRGGQARAVAYTSVGLSIATSYVAAVLVAAAAWPAAASSLVGDVPGPLVLAAPLVALLGLHPAVLGRVVAVCERVLGDAERVVVPAWRDTVRVTALHIPAWLLIGGATWLVVRALGATPPFAAVLFATVASWIAGFVVLAAPGGIGVREATFAAVLSGAVPTSLAVTAALGARVVFITADLVGAALAVLCRGTVKARP